MSLSLSHWYPGSGVVLDVSIPDLCTLTYFVYVLEFGLTLGKCSSTSTLMCKNRNLSPEHFESYSSIVLYIGVLVVDCNILILLGPR